MYEYNGYDTETLEYADYGLGEDYFNYGYSPYVDDSGTSYDDYGNPTSNGFVDESGVLYDASGNPSAEGYTPNQVYNGATGASLNSLISQYGKSAFNAAKAMFTDKDGNVDWGRVAAAAGGIYGLTQGGGNQQKQGYLGGIPTYQAVRQQVDAPVLPARPGDPGRRYFSDMTYATPEKAAEAQTAAATQATGIAGLNQAAMSAVRPTPNTVEQLYGMVLNRAPDQGGLDYWKGQFGESVDPTELARFTGSNATLAEMTAPRVAKYATAPAASVTNPTAASKVIEKLPVPENKAAGGIAGLKSGRYLDGPTDGMADKLPTTIDGKDPAALSHGEFVIPADVVGHLGNGNSEAGAQRLYAMMDKIRKARTGTKKQGKEINPDKYLPA
jgi:hypothetical protein